MALRIFTFIGMLGMLWTLYQSSGQASEDPIARLGLPAHAGKVVYVDFWASWCVPCRASFGWMAAMHEKYGDDGLVIIAVNVDTDQTAAARFLQKYPAEFRLLYDPAGKIAERFDLETMPSSFVYGRGGELRAQHPGFRDGDGEELEAQIVKLLKEDVPE